MQSKNCEGGVNLTFRLCNNSATTLGKSHPDSYPDQNKGQRPRASKLPKQKKSPASAGDLVPIAIGMDFFFLEFLMR